MFTEFRKEMFVKENKFHEISYTKSGLKEATLSQSTSESLYKCKSKQLEIDNNQNQ